VHTVILWVVAGAALALAGAGLALSLLDTGPGTRRGRAAGRLLLGLAALTEAAVVVQSAVAGAGLAAGHAVRSTPTFIGYLAGILFVVPVAVVWAWADRTRWSGSVVAIGGLAVAVMTARLAMMWQGRA
jgi:hypothetical protein